MKGMLMSDTTAERGTNPAEDGGPELDAAGQAGRAEQLRAALVERLRDEGKIVSDAVEAAVRAVSRERFMPEGTPLEIAYAFDNSVITKRDDRGPLSSVSAAYIQARMLEQARLEPGMRVLEIGSGGLNAAYIAEIVGEQGQVVSVDIDAEVTDRAAKLLDEAGYGSRVRVLVADADNGVPGEDAFDAIIVTVGAACIAPAWLRQLADAGTVVVPLVMNGVTRTIGFRREGDHLVSTSTEVAGFVPMQGSGAIEERLVTLTGPAGKPVTLRFQSDVPQDGQVDQVLAADCVVAWSGVEFPNGVSWADLYLWFAWYLPGFCRFSAEPGSELDQHEKRFPFGAVHGNAFAYLVIQPAMDDTGVEFGARAFGPDAEVAAQTLVEQIRAWDRDGRHAAEPTFGYWPADAEGRLHGIPSDAAVMPRPHGVITISWPAKD
jgi:protein-L-isoaspartate(D-aspartate) O-methyltransferase